MGIAEQMGRVLQRTSISVNIKERLDFSCALFGPDGSLVRARARAQRPPTARAAERGLGA
jgi:N-methylhydantoinase B/oxoprolinase/acetone carboxylase alpha subunit